jgi:DNA-binding CsgD family transcriptional regulator
MTPALLATILDINRLGHGLSPKAFDEAVLDVINQLIPFDSAVIGSGVLLNGEICPVSFTLRGVDLRFMELLRQYQHLDRSSLEAFESPGVTIVRCADDKPREFQEAVLNHYPVHHSIVTGTIDHKTGAIRGISINRSREHGVFSEEERMLKQLILPHWNEAFSQNRVFWATLGLKGTVCQPYSTIVTNLEGFIVAASDLAMSSLKSIFDGWQGSELPVQLREKIATLTAVSFNRVLRTDAFIVQAMKADASIVWQLRAPTPVDLLTDREYQVAKAYSLGSSHKEIAKELSIAPSTVSNQLTHVYEKLNVTNKASLASLFGKSE